ncbi:MAG: potassium/proton antiporter [Elusimicrobia bacterium]|nr:potassium/proton antiporter [Candidatus Liberimonas magnetica]
MPSIEHIITGFSLLLIISIIASKASSRFGIPSLLIFLFIGIFVGSKQIGDISFHDTRLAQYIGVVALVFILFSGGLETDWKVVKPVLWHGIYLSTFGVLITAVALGFFAVYVLHFSIIEGLLLGSVVSSTDAAAVFSVLRSRKISLSGNLRPLLELESGSNDPMAVFLTIGFISILSETSKSMLDMIPLFVMQMGIGAFMGYLFGKGILLLINKVKLEYDGLYPVFTTSLVLLAYALTNMFNGSGFLAIYIAGLMMGNSNFVQKRNLIHFHSGIAWLMQIAMFLTLGLLVVPSKIASIAWTGFMVSIFLMFVARPLSVFIALFKTGLFFREKLFISWVGLRGSVPIILATFPLLAGVQIADMVFNIAFFIVLTSAIFQGTSIAFMAKLLKVEVPFKDKIQYPLQFEQTDDLNTRLIDFTIPYNSWMIDKTVARIGLPDDSLITLIARSDDFVVPSGKTKVEAGDVLLILVNNNNLQEILDLLSSKHRDN